MSLRPMLCRRPSAGPAGCAAEATPCSLTSYSSAHTHSRCPPAALCAQVLLGSTAPIPEQYSAELRGVLGAMLQPDPAQRITMAQLLAHPAVAPRLAQLQRAGVVGMAPGAPSPPLPTAPPGSELSLDDLQRLLPAPRYGHPCNPAPHTPDPLMSAWFRTDSALDRSARASSPPAAPAPRSHDQALPPARPAIQRQLSRSLHNVGAAEAPAEVAKLPVKLHPKYAALAAAALEAEAGGLAPKRPGRPGVAASQAPATPRAPPRQPSRPLSKTGSGASAASTPRRPATSCSGLQARALEARIDAVRRSGSGAAALAAAVRDSLAESDAQMVLQLTSRLSRLRSAGSPAASGGERLWQRLATLAACTCPGGVLALAAA